MKSVALLAILSQMVDERLSEASQSRTLRGPRGPVGEQGQDGRDGIDGESFSFENSAKEITEILNKKLEEISPKLKLQFSDLSSDEISQITGPKGRDGRDGRDGKNFNFEDHREYFDSLKLKFSDLTQDEIDNIKLKFSDLTPEDISSIKLKFSDLSEDEKLSLRGARGQRGKPGRDGESIKGDKGDRGPRGEIGPKGIDGKSIRGEIGPQGRSGLDGSAAPVITNFLVETYNKDEISFRINLSNGESYETNKIKLPSSTQLTGIIAGGVGGGGGEGGTVTVEVGTVTTGAPGTDAIVTNVGTDENVILDFTIPRGNTGASGSGGVSLTDVSCFPDVYVGALVYLEKSDIQEVNMDEWPSMSSLLSLSLETYVSKAALAKADDIDTSNVIGVVQSKGGAEVCTVQTGGPTEENYFGLDVYKEYFLSNVIAGGFMVNPPVTPGHIKIKIGKPINHLQMFISVGDIMEV